MTLQGCVCSDGITEQFCRDFPDNEYLDLADNSNWKDNGDSVLVQMFTTSYIWLPGIGTFSTLVFGIIFSLLVIVFDKTKKKKVHAKLLSKPLIIMWNKILGESWMQNWIDYDETVGFGKGKIK